MISIIGGGPIGSYAAYLLASKGKKVSVYEEHNKIGLPVQCTGIVTDELSNIIRLRKRFIINKITNANIYSPSDKFINIKFRNKNLILDRTNFDRFIAEKAESVGVKYFLRHKFIGCKGNILKFNRCFKKTDLLIGADGPLSRVAKCSGLYKDRKVVVGLQARMNLNVDKNLVSFYLNKNYFGWLVPENESIARAGIVAEKNHNLYFKKFLKRIGKSKIREYQSGVIPLYNPKSKIQNKNVFLVGDAAGQVKASTFGGIIPGLKAAQELSKAITYNKNYEKLCKKRIGRELKLHLKLRRILNNFSEKDYEKLIKLVNQNKIKTLLEKYDRDNLKKYAWKLLLKEPRFLKYLFK